MNTELRNKILTILENNYPNMIKPYSLRKILNVERNKVSEFNKIIFFLKDSELIKSMEFPVETRSVNVISITPKGIQYLEDQKRLENEWYLQIIHGVIGLIKKWVNPLL